MGNLDRPHEAYHLHPPILPSLHFPSDKAPKDYQGDGGGSEGMARRNVLAGNYSQRGGSRREIYAQLSRRTWRALRMMKKMSMCLDIIMSHNWWENTIQPPQLINQGEELSILKKLQARRAVWGSLVTQGRRRGSGGGGGEKEEF